MASVRERDPLFLAAPMARPVLSKNRVGSRQREKRRQAHDAEILARGRAGGTLTALHGLGRSSWDEKVLELAVFQEGGSSSSSSCPESGLRIIEDLRDQHLRRPLMDLGLSHAGALVRLVGETKYKWFAPGEFSRRGAKTTSSVPLRGEMWPAVVADIDLPPEGNVPVSAGRMARRVRETLEKWEAVMLNPDVDEERRRNPVEAYDDPALLLPDAALLLAKRLWKAGMLVETKVVHDYMSLFTVVKKLEGSRILLRLIIDNRRGNQRWRVPPWCGLAGPSALSSLSFRAGMEQGGTFDAACGDLPHFFYTLGLPREFASFFGLKGIETGMLRKALLEEGWGGVLPDPPLGEHLGLGVAAMGWSWAVWIAQNCLLGVVSSALPPGSLGRVLIQGGKAPRLDLSEGECWLVWVYVDDFGVLGMFGPGMSAKDGRVRFIYFSIRRRFISLGFKVHKEEMGPVITALGLKIGHLDEEGMKGPITSEMIAGLRRVLVRPTDEKRAVLELGTAGLLEREDVPIAWLMSICGTWVYYMLLRRPILSVFNEIYRFTNDYKPEQVLPMPMGLKKELGAARHLTIYLEADLTRRLWPEMMMGDASPTGGAVGAGLGSQADLEEEASWANKGGFYTVRETDILMAEVLDDWVPAEEMGQRGPKEERTERTLMLSGLLVLLGPPVHFGLQWWLDYMADKLDVVVEVTNLDLRAEDGVDICDPLLMGQLVAELRAGRWDFILGSLPGGTWSSAPWAAEEGRAMPGPKPLRSREEPWGLSTLNQSQRKRLKRCNQILENVLHLMEVSNSMMVPWGFVHPCHGFPAPAPSFWTTDRWEGFRSSVRPKEVDYDMCMWGGSGKQPMRMVGGHWNLEVCERRCAHPHGHPGLLGRSVSGALKTASGGAFSSELAQCVAPELLGGALAKVGAGEILPPLVHSSPVSGVALPGSKLRAPSISRSWDDIEKWRELYRWDWKQKGEPTNTTESRVIVSGLRHLSRNSKTHGARIVFATDNLAALAVFSRGRSSRAPLLQLSRLAAAMILCFGWSMIFRWVESRRNHLDGPSRRRKLGYYAGD
jgi:hypothetical protein